MQHNNHLVQLVKTPHIRMHPDEAKETVTIGRESYPVKQDPFVAKGTVVIPLGFHEIPAYELGENLLNGMRIPNELTF